LLRCKPGKAAINRIFHLMPFFRRQRSSQCRGRRGIRRPEISRGENKQETEKKFRQQTDWSKIVHLGLTG
jgi:hypothetical protein